MNKLVTSGLWLLLVFMLVVALSACSPVATPAPAPAPVAPPAAPTATTAAALALSPEEAAWQKVVAAARKEGEATAYSGSWMGDVGLAVSRAFENRYGVRLDIITGRGAEFVERLNTERRAGQITGDMMEGSSTHVTNAKKAGLTLAMKDLPVLKETAWVSHPFSQDPEGHLIGIRLVINSMGINTKLVKTGEEPQSLLDVLQPRWKGKMMIVDPNLAGSAYELLVFVRRNIVDMDYMRALGAQDLRFTTGHTEDIRLLSQGQRSLSLFAPSSTVAPFINEGAPIRLLAPKEGVLAKMGPVAAIKDAPHPNATKLFLNWILSQEGQQVYSQAQGVASVRSDVTDYTPEGARVGGAKRLVLTIEDDEETGRLFSEKSLAKMWGR